MTDTIVAKLDQRQAVFLWPQIEEWLREAVKLEGLYEPVDILLHHLKDTMQIWVAFNEETNLVDAVMVTVVHVYPRKNICMVEYVRGRNMKSWADKFVNASEDFARSRGCVHMAGGHRKGWARVAGYRVVGPMLVKDLK